MIASPEKRKVGQSDKEAENRESAATKWKGKHPQLVALRDILHDMGVGFMEKWSKGRGGVSKSRLNCAINWERVSALSGVMARRVIIEARI